MFTNKHVLMLYVLFFLYCFSSALKAQTALPNCSATTNFDAHKSEPRLIDYQWMGLDAWYRQHATHIKQTSEMVERDQSLDVLFIGDSITAGWPQSVWRSLSKERTLLNFAIGGDTTHNLLWRMSHGHYDKLKPKVVNLLIGVNNMGLAQQKPKQAYCGVIAVVEATLRLYPNAKIVLNQLLPWGETPDSWTRQNTQRVNQLLGQYPFPHNVHLVKIWHEFLDENGHLAKSVMPDFLHPAEFGYQIYAKKLFPTLRRFSAN